MYNIVMRGFNKVTANTNDTSLPPAHRNNNIIKFLFLLLNGSEKLLEIVTNKT